MSQTTLRTDMLDPARLSHLLAFRQILRDDGYEEGNVEALLGHSLAAQRIALFPAYAYRTLTDDSACSLWTRLWLLGQPVSLQGRLPPPVLETLVDLGLLAPHADQYKSCVDLYPCAQIYCFTDPRWQYFPDKVYHLGADSYCLTRLAPPPGPSRAADLCTGSGIQALRRAHPEMHLVDLNPRALAFAGLNLAFNELSGELHQGSLWEPLQGRFDRISANPPFVPLPAGRNRALYQGGGASGEEVTWAVLARAGEFLKPGGVLSVVTQAPWWPGQQPVLRLRERLGPGPWGILHLTLARIPAAEYLALLLPGPEEQGYPGYAREFAQGLEHYDAHGYTHMRDAVYLITRLSDPCSEWGLELEVPYPSQDLSARIGPWLDSLRETHEGQREGWELAPCLLSEDSLWRQDEWLGLRREVLPAPLVEAARSLQQGLRVEAPELQALAGLNLLRRRT